MTVAHTGTGTAVATRKVPRWILVAAGFFGSFALVIGLATMLNPAMFDLDRGNDQHYLVMVTSAARNFGLGGLLLVTMIRRRAAELRLSLGLRAFVDLADMLLSFGAPTLNPVSLVMAGLFALVAGWGALAAHRVAEANHA